jgi:hypothetical protein
MLAESDYLRITQDFADSLGSLASPDRERLTAILQPALDRLIETADVDAEEVIEHAFDGVPVAVFRLPLSARAFGLINEVVEALYGEGEYQMSMQGEQVEIIAPKGGVKRRVRRGPFHDIGVELDDNGRVLSAANSEGAIDIVWEQPETQVLLIGESLRQWFDAVGGVNYVEQHLLTRGQEREDAEWVFTMQRAEGITPHGARKAAEARVAALEAQLEGLGVEPCTRSEALPSEQ